MAENQISIILVEDDKNLGFLLKEYLIAKNFKVELLFDGEQGYKSFLKNQYDLCIFDIMMPVKDGYSLAVDIRKINSAIPIIFLTAKSMKEDILEGFRVGADDFISKPFNMEELLYRIEAILRRTSQSQITNGQNIYKLGKFTFDYNKNSLSVDDRIIKLTTKESELLKLLCKNVNVVLDRNFALKTIWLDDNYFNARSMDVYITKLRKILKEEPSIEIINIHGKGFKLII